MAADTVEEEVYAERFFWEEGDIALTRSKAPIPRERAERAKASLHREMDVLKKMLPTP